VWRRGRVDLLQAVQPELQALRRLLHPAQQYLQDHRGLRMLRVLVIVALAGCGPARLPGAPEPGKACDGQTPECSSVASISICESGKWADYGCPSSCSNAQATRCDWSKAQVGDECPASMEGLAVGCNATGTAGLGCRGGLIAETPCPRCVVREDMGSITCN
jgi:hypothetical protein